MYQFVKLGIIRVCTIHYENINRTIQLVNHAPSREITRCHDMHSCRCHYTKSNPIDDHSNISSKMLQKQSFKPLGHYTCMQCGASHLQTVQENILSHIILATYRKFSGNRQIHTKCQLQYLHSPQISTSGKCHCVIIHQTTKATEYIGYMSKDLHK